MLSEIAASDEFALAHFAAESVQALFEEADVPPPSTVLPIAPLGPLLERLKIAQSELPNLTVRAVEQYLQSRVVVGNSGLGLTGDQNLPLSGFLFASGSAARLFVNADEAVVRRRFSVAHELGHFVLHFRPRLSQWREAIESGMDMPSAFCDSFSIVDSEDDLAEDNRDAMLPDNTIDRQEREADAFATALLMPQSVVRPRWAALATDFSGGMLIDRLAMEFLVSRAAMRRRLRGLVEQV